MGNRWWTKKEDIILEEYFYKRVPFKDIATELNRTRYSIVCRLQKLKLKRVNSIDNFFDRNDEISNYILGYWLADGYISKRGGGHYFSIASIDFNHLSKMRDIMGIKTNFSISNNCYIMVVGNKNLYENIQSFGGIPRKTHDIKITDIKYNEINLYDFLRGYFDGDGSIPIQKRKRKDGSFSYFMGAIKFTGSKNIIYSLHKLLINDFKCKITEDKRSEKNNCFYLSFSSKSGIDFLNKIYGNSPNIYLDRKYQRYTEYVVNKNL